MYVTLGPCKLQVVASGVIATCVGVLETTKFREMLRQSPLPNLDRPKRNKRCSSSVQGIPFLLSCSLFAGFCGCTHVKSLHFKRQVCFTEQPLILLDATERQQVQNSRRVGLTPLDAMTGSAEARYFGRGILPASMFRTSSCNIAKLKNC